ncbi:hypothetical protein ACFV7N_31280, partial [Streptomyces tendae]
MTDHTDHHAPEGLRTRGTVVVVPGRGETRTTYGRLAARLAADAYRVRIVDAPDLDAGGVEAPDGTDAALARFGSLLAEAVDGTTGSEGVREPVVLLGADAGAAALAALLGRTGRRARGRGGAPPRRPPRPAPPAARAGPGGGGWRDAP